MTALGTLLGPPWIILGALLTAAVLVNAHEAHVGDVPGDREIADAMMVSLSD